MLFLISSSHFFSSFSRTVSLSQVIVLVEKDVVSDIAISALEYIADCSIRLEDASQKKDRIWGKGKFFFRSSLIIF